MLDRGLQPAKLVLRPPRVMFVIDEPDHLCGPNVWLTRHLPKLKRLGFAPEILVASWADRPCRYADALERGGIPVGRVALHGHMETAVSALLSAVADNPPDVFVPNCSVVAHVAARYLREAGVVTVAICHSDDPYYHELFELFVAGEPEWRVSAFVSVSATLTEMAAARARWPVPLLHAPYGAPAPEVAACWRPDRLRAIYAGRLVEAQKRVTRTAAHLVAAARAVPRFEAVLYGDGAARLDVERVIESAGDDVRVRLGGALPHPAIQMAMADAQVFVLLSDFEGLSIALMEAMASGLVPIVSRVRSGASDLVRHGDTGFLVDADDHEAFIRICRQLADDRALWERVSRAARTIVIERGYTIERCASTWAEFLRPLIPAQRPAAPLRVPSNDDLIASGVRTTPDNVLAIHYGHVTGRRRLQEVSAAGRPLFLWGAGAAGERFLEVSAGSLPITGVIDSDARKQGTTLRGLPVTLPVVLNLRTDDTSTPRPFVIVTSEYAYDISASLDARGFLSGRDYLIG